MSDVRFQAPQLSEAKLTGAGCERRRGREESIRFLPCRRLFRTEGCEGANGYERREIPSPAASDKK